MFLKKKKIFEKFKKKIPIICITSYTAPIAKIADKYACTIKPYDYLGSYHGRRSIFRFRDSLCIGISARCEAD